VESSNQHGISAGLFRWFMTAARAAHLGIGVSSSAYSFRIRVFGGALRDFAAVRP